MEQFRAIEREIENFEKLKRESALNPYHPFVMDINKIREEIKERIEAAEKIKVFKAKEKTEKEKEFEKMLESVRGEIEHLEMLRNPKISGTQKTHKFSSEIKNIPREV